MQIHILAVGKESPASLRDQLSEYERRIKPYAAVTWKLLPASLAQEQTLIRDQESQQLLAQLKPNDRVILLDERGQQQSNEDFARTFEKLAGFQGRIVCIIGGAFGVNEVLRERADFVWSLSKLVFPHQLVRVMLLEQLYRTFMVQQGHPYHHT